MDEGTKVDAGEASTQQTFDALLAMPGGKAMLEAHNATQTQGLVANRDDILGKLHSEKATKAELEAQLMQYRRRDDDVKNKNLVEAGEFKLAMKATEDKHSKELSDMQKQLGEIATREKSLIIENTLTANLSKINVNKSYLPAVKALLLSQGVEHETTSKTTTIGGKEISAYLGEWAKSDEGKVYISASDGSGGGTKGSGNDAKGVVDMKSLMSINPRELITMGIQHEITSTNK